MKAKKASPRGTGQSQAARAKKRRDLEAFVSFVERTARQIGAGKQYTMVVNSWDLTSNILGGQFVYGGPPPPPKKLSALLRAVKAGVGRILKGKQAMMIVSVVDRTNNNLSGQFVFGGPPPPPIKAFVYSTF